MSEYLCTFSHPTTWRHIFGTIIKKLGPDFHKWDNGIRFEKNDTVLVITNRDGDKVKVLLCGIDVSQQLVVREWFRILKEAKKKTPELILPGGHPSEVTTIG